MEHRVVKGVRLAFQREGQGPPLLLLHGLGGSHDDWRKQVPVFARRYSVIAPDLRGFGDSERQEPFTVQQHARDVAGLLDALGIARAHVVGLSMGGAVAMELALSEPGRVAGLVLANTAPGFELRGWQRRYMGFSRLLLALLFGVGGVARLFSKAVFPAPHQESACWSAPAIPAAGSTSPRCVRWSAGTRRSACPPCACPRWSSARNTTTPTSTKSAAGPPASRARRW
jgi:3-oxoadipate enol-lactonase